VRLLLRLRLRPLLLRLLSLLLELLQHGRAHEKRISGLSIRILLLRRGLRLLLNLRLRLILRNRRRHRSLRPRWIENLAQDLDLIHFQPALHAFAPG
jgi:hypothetical protein